MSDKPKIKRKALKRKGDTAAEALGAQPFTATLEEVKAALADIPCPPALGQEQWSHIGSAVFVVTNGSEEGFKLFDEWSQQWFYHNAEDTRRRWDSLRTNPPTNIAAGELFNLTEKALASKAAQAAADNKRIDELAAAPKLDYDRQREAEAKRLGVRVLTLDELVEKARRTPKPPPPKPVVDIDKLAASAKEIIDSENVLDLFAEHVESRLTGERRNAKLLYLVYTTRLFDTTMNAAVKGLSAIGKSHLRDLVLKYMPPEDVVAFTTLSEKALFFLPDDLSHKILSMAEAAGTKEQDMQDYIMREIISTGSIRHMITQKDPNTGHLATAVIEKKGPIVFATTTTKGKLHPEIETRILTLETDDTEKQTQRVLVKVAEIEGGLVGAEADLMPWLDYQRYLAAGERRVVIPYARELARLTWGKSVRMRRDFGQVLRAIKAHALLHRQHRQRDEKGRIIATVADYKVVYGLMAARLAEGSEVKLRSVVEKTVKAVERLERDKPADKGVTTREVVDDVGLDRTTIWRRLDVARRAGFIENLEAREGRQAQWRTSGQKADDDVLPTAPELEAKIARHAPPKISATVQHDELSQ
jgi:Primase C terminal 2 (PriCT-2)